ncbi:MAG: zinc ribbon domain-containing protein [Candidatus Bathyarchaeia archaeon]
MVYCVKCGAEVPEGAGYCPKCGLQVTVTPAVGGRDSSGLGGVLILAGGLLAIIFSIASLLFMHLLRGFPSGWMGMHMMWGGWFVGFMTVRASVSLVLGLVAVYSYSKIVRGDLKVGGIIAVVAGVLMLVTMSWLPGVMVLIGGVLCHASK